MATQQEVIKKFMKSLDTTSKSGKLALDAAIKACSSFGNLKSVVTQLIGDCQSATDAKTFLKEKCGIILDNKDTGAITGSDAGGSKAKTAEKVSCRSRARRPIRAVRVSPSAGLKLSSRIRARSQPLNKSSFKDFTAGGLIRH